MKNIRFIAVIALMMMGGMTMKAQDYHPIVEEGKQWNVLFSYPWNPPEPQHKYTDIYKIEGDTLLDGVSYKVMYTTRNEDLTGWSVCGVIRETEDKQVLYRRDGSSYDEILYDFSMEVGDTIIMSGSGFYPDWMFVIETNEILVNGEPRQQIVLEYPFGNGEEEVWIEGIGSLYGIVDSGSLFLTGGSTNLLCYYEDGDLIWQNTTPGYNECYMVYPTPPTPPEPHSFAPQGAEWYFNLSSFMGSPISYYHMEVLGDTIIQGHICSVITQQFLGGNGQEQYVYEANGKVYWYNQTLGRFTTLYDFDAEVGESWTCEIDSCTYEVTVTEITYYEGLDQNHQFRAQRVSYNGELGYFGGGTIIDGIGEISGLFPYPYACVGDIYDGPYPDWLRCYLVDGEMLYHGGDYECDEIVDVPYPSYPFAVGDLLYTIISDNPPQVSVYGHVNGENAQGELIIPETVNYEGVTYTVTKIGYEAFYQCSGLTGNLVIPSTVDTIMTRAFKNCSGFTGDLVIPNSVRHLGGGAFEWCYGFDGTLVLPEAIPAIYSYTFQGCTGLTGTLNIPSTVTSIGPAAFGLCTGFTGTLVIPESVVELSTPVPPVNGIRGAFEECSGFTGLVLPESLRIIGGGSGGGCFAYCTGLTGELVIPNKVKVIGHSAFYNCTGLTGELHLPDSLQSIGYEAFALCSGLTGRLVFPDALETIDNEAFAGCSGFSDVDLHHQVFYQNIFGDAVFAYWSMESLELPEGWTTTGKYTFKGCGNLRTVHLPESLTKIDGDCFQECSSLTDVDIPENVTIIESGAFDGCSSLTSLELPANLSQLGGYALRNCTSLAGELVVPDRVELIQPLTFAGCTNLNQIVLGSSVNTIYDNAFKDMVLDTLVIKATTPPVMRHFPNQGLPFDQLVIVPCGRLEAYQNAEGWSDFTNITEDCGSGDDMFEAYCEAPNDFSGWPFVHQGTYGAYLSWNQPLGGHWFHYDEKPYAGSVWCNYWGIKIPAEEIQAGDVLTHVAFYKAGFQDHLAHYVFAFSVGGDMEPDNLDFLPGNSVQIEPGPDEWVMVKLGSPINCEEGKSLWIVLTAPNVEVNNAAYCQTSGNSDGRWASSSGGYWYDYSSVQGSGGDWMIRGYFNNWGHYNEDFDHYNLYRGSSLEELEKIAEVDRNEVEYNDTLQNPFGDYYYSLTASYTDGRESDPAKAWTYFHVGNISSLGSEWYYEIQNENGSITYQHLQYAADTTINHKDVKIIIRTNTLYDKGEHGEVTREYIYEDFGKVYWWNESIQDFTLLYNLGAQVGDEWVIEVGEESIIMHVDAVEQYEYEGTTYRMLHVSDANNLFSGEIMSGVGHLTSFFPERLMTRDKGYRVTGLRCYWIYGDLVFTVNRGDCDAIYAELHIGLDEPTAIPFAIYPNPTNSVLTIQHSSFNIPNSSFRITNLMGQTVQTGSLNAETQQIDVSGLPQGMYFISVGEMTRKFVVR